MKSFVLATIIFASILFLSPVVAVATSSTSLAPNNNDSKSATTTATAVSASVTAKVTSSTPPTSSPNFPHVVTGTGMMGVTSSQLTSSNMTGHVMHANYNNTIVMTGFMTGTSMTTEHDVINMVNHTANVVGQGIFTSDFGTATVTYQMKIDSNGMITGNFVMHGLTGVMTGANGHGSFQGMFGQPLSYTVTIETGSIATSTS